MIPLPMPTPGRFDFLRPPPHQENVDACPCPQCGRARMVGDALRNQSEAVRFVLYLKWLRWVTRERTRKRRPTLRTCDPAQLEEEANR